MKKEQITSSCFFLLCVFFIGHGFKARTQKNKKFFMIVKREARRVKKDLNVKSFFKSLG